MKRCKLLEYFGFRYIINKNTGEIHDLDNEHKNCHIGMMRKAKYITKAKLFKLLKSGKANGCRYCLKKWDTG